MSGNSQCHITFLRERNISVVWSPVSNLLLYGDTLDIEALMNEGINVTIGSDWAPSGTKHIWEETKFARWYFDAIGSTVSDQQIFEMATTNAGRCLGLPHLGRIEPGALGDFFILRSPLETDNPLEVFMSTTDRHVRATIIAGAPIFGDRKFLQKFGVPLQMLPRVEGTSVADKAVYLPPKPLRLISIVTSEKSKHRSRRCQNRSNAAIFLWTPTNPIVARSNNCAKRSSNLAGMPRSGAARVPRRGLALRWCRLIQFGSGEGSKPTK